MFLEISKAAVLESLLNKVEDEVFKNKFFYKTPPVATSVVFATKQLNIQCYNDNLGVITINCHGNTVIIITLPI